MNTILMRTVVDFAAFLSLSEDEMVNPDAAVAQLEYLAAALKQLNLEERLLFIRFTKNLAEEETQLYGASQRTRFLDTLAQNLGLEGA